MFVQIKKEIRISAAQQPVREKKGTLYHAEGAMSFKIEHSSHVGNSFPSSIVGGKCHSVMLGGGRAMFSGCVVGPATFFLV